MKTKSQSANREVKSPYFKDSPSETRRTRRTTVKAPAASTVSSAAEARKRRKSEGEKAVKSPYFHDSPPERKEKIVSNKKRKKKKNEEKEEEGGRLAKQESISGVETPKRKRRGRAKAKQQHKTSDSSSSDWEEVAEIEDPQPKPTGSVEVVLKRPESKEEKNRFLILRRYLNRVAKVRQASLLKVYLLCCVAHGRHLSRCCSDPMVAGMALSMVPSNAALIKKGSKRETTILTLLVRWFRESYKLASGEPPAGVLCAVGLNRLKETIVQKVVIHKRDQAMAFVAMSRSLGMDARLIVAHRCTGLFDVANQEDEDLLNIIRESPPSSKAKSKKRDSKAEVADNAESFVYWPEVYLPSEEKWYCVNLSHDGTLIDSKAVEPLCSDVFAYCIGFDKEHTVKDVTARYASNYGTRKFRQHRVDESWWQNFLKPYRSTIGIRDRLEDMLLEKQLQERPLPTRLSEYKNHPLYVLERDLLKFEALYPKDVKPVGTCSKIPVYPRSAVVRLNGKEAWIREARVIKPDEEPYKVVKARPKMNIPKEQRIDRPLPLYGMWQTEEYVPPEAKDGVVPKNEFGNIELYQMSMLPKGTVYLNVPGISNVAKKLDIDCVPAVVGWEFHCRSSHPILEGVVVCEEYKETLLAAWREERQITMQKEKERKTARALRNWRRLCRGLLIKMCIGRKFSLNKDSETPHTSSSQSQPVTSWPHCRHEFVFDECLSD